MRHWLLVRIDQVLFVVATFVCGLIVHFSPSRPCLLGLLALPIVLTAAFSGVREKFFPSVGDESSMRSCAAADGAARGAP